MIASVDGVVQAVRLDSAIVEAGGFGMLVYGTPGTLATLRVGERARLHTSFVVREDSMTLYGFADADEREVFEIVQTVSGVGPRLALAMLAVHEPDALRRAVADGDLTALMRVPGIGKKGAQRIVLELTDRLGAPTSAGAPTPSVQAADRQAQVVEALVGLGWSAKPAQDAVADVLSAREQDVVQEGDVADVLRASLRILGGAHA